MKKSRIRFWGGTLFFVFWLIFEDAKSILIRNFLGIDVSESIYFSRTYPIGLISILLFFTFSFLYNHYKKVKHDFSLKDEIKILTIYLLIFLLPIILLGKQCTIITEKNIIEYNICGKIKNQYSLTDIDNVHCNLYNIRGNSQFAYSLTIENSSITIYGTDNEEDWKAMVWIDTIAKTNDIPKIVNASISVEEIKNYSTFDRIINGSTGVYTHIGYVEELLKTSKDNQGTVSVKTE